MPLTAKGNKIMAAMLKEYGAKKGKSVFYASENAGRISGVHHKGGFKPPKGMPMQPNKMPMNEKMKGMK